MTIYQTQSKQTIRLTDEIAKGGEGTIYNVQGNKAVVAKIYHDNRLSQGNKLEEKLKTMLCLPPKQDSDKAIIWPIDLLYDHNIFVGYLMPRVEQTINLFELYNPQKRQELYSGTDLKYLHIVAKNLAIAFVALHNAGYVMGDVNQKNVLVNRDGTVRLVDTDSFQVRAQSGEVFRCAVGVPEYIPSEMRNKNLSEVDRNPEQDLFGLGVLMFQLLMEGQHPFAGAPRDPSFSVEQPVTDYCIEQGIFPYDPMSRNQYTPPRNAPDFNSLHSGVRELFIQCFVDGHSNPKSRPTALDWYNVLTKAIDDLSQCMNSETHWYFPVNGSCPWCSKPIPSQTPYISPTALPIPYASGCFFYLLPFVIIIGIIYTILNVVAIKPLEASVIVTPTSPFVSTSPTVQVESTAIPSVTPTIFSNTNPTPNLMKIGDGQCPIPNFRTQLTPSQRAVANDILILRVEPYRDADPLGKVGTGEIVTLIQGPLCSENWLWWQVRASNNQIGWIVEIGRGGEIQGGGIYLLLPEGSELGAEVN